MIAFNREGEKAASVMPRCGAGSFSAHGEKKIRPLTVGLTGERYISRQKLEYLKGSELHVPSALTLFMGRRLAIFPLLCMTGGT